MNRIIIPILFLLTSFVFAQIKYVPTDYKKIQDAIDDSKDGDVVIIEEGKYFEQINFKGKAITVASEFYLDNDTAHISKTILDGGFFIDKDSAALVYINSGEDSTSVLSGLTLQHGKGTTLKMEYVECYGGAISIEYSGATIANNIFKNNAAITKGVYRNDWSGAFGGAIDIFDLPFEKTIIISKNHFESNSTKSHTAQSFGGGLSAMDIKGKLKITQNRFIRNKVESVKSGYGGGICIAGANSESIIVIANNYIGHNSTYSEFGSTKGGGIACYFSAPIIRNNIIVYNETKYPISLSKDAFGGGIAVFWYTEFMADWEVCENPYSLVAVIEKNTIAYNNDKLAGGGVAFRSVGIKFKNNIVGCNFSKNDAQIKVEYPDAPETETRTVKIDYCNIEGGCEGISEFHNGEGNINKFPEFTDGEMWYFKKELSPCIDAGDPSEEYEDIADVKNIGQAYFPAMGSLRNDIGTFGGPYSKWGETEKPTDIKNENTLLVEKFFLSQNYPNPFNPSTTIKYLIPIDLAYRQAGVKSQRAKGKNVVLKIYDILGRELATLVNHKQNPGNYEVEWEASKYPNGIYFYRLYVGDYTATKKMILIK